MKNRDKICIAIYCCSKVHIKNMCRIHYVRFNKYGDTEVCKRRQIGTGNINGGYIRFSKMIDGKQKSFLEHRMVMEKYLGRTLKRSEHVHHIDHNKLNNKIENLKVISSSEHSKLHHPIGKNYGGGNSPNRKNLNINKWSYKHQLNACILCNRSTIRHHSNGHCCTCLKLVRRLALS